MEIEVGEYIRDKEGNITKIINILSLFKDVYLYLGEDGYQYSENAIIKHSKNIIDLIEVGDYVNGKRVIYVASIENKDDEEELCVFVEETQDCIEAKDIKSIVTKEQFENLEYKVGE